MAEYAKIFAALDGGSTQRMVMQRAIALAADNQAQLLFGHVMDSVPAEANGADFDKLCAEGRARLDELVGDLLEEARSNDAIPSVEVRVDAGRVVDTLTERQIKPFAPDLVICGERGLSPIKYAFVGSVSTHLIRNMPCDVLVVKQR